MKQLGLGFNLSTEKTRKRQMREEMAHMVPWGVLVKVVGGLQTSLRGMKRRLSSRTRRCAPVSGLEHVRQGCSAPAPVFNI